MSLRAFQAALARLVAEPGFREAVQRQGDAILGPGLTEKEYRRLQHVAADPGIEVTSLLISSFRLGKVLLLLPLTRTLLGNQALAREVRRFWASEPPRSFYALDECLAFCDHLLHRTRRGAYTDDVVGLERAVLTLRRVRADGEAQPPQEVRFRHDPKRLLGLLVAGRRPRHVRERPCVVRAIMGADGTVQWSRAISSSGTSAGREK